MRDVIPCVDSGAITPALLKQPAAERDRIDERIADMTNARNQLNLVIYAAQNFDTECPRPR